MSAQTQRYTVVAIVLHWAIAIAIFGLIALGWWMGDALHEEATQAQAFAAFQLHKSIGLTVLALSIARVLWRVTHKAPPLPAHMPAWERRLARGTQWAFYALILILPLTGWLYVSTAWSPEEGRAFDVPTVFFGLIPVPHLFGLSHLADETRAALAGALEFSHSKLAWVAIVLAVTHAGAALKHHLFDQDEVLTQMVPGLKPLAGEAPPPDPRRRAGLIAGFAAIALAFAGSVALFLSPPAPAASAPASVVATAPAAEAEPDPSPPGQPPLWRVDYGASAIRFAGAHVGQPFEGAFARWRADIRFDPENLDASKAVVSIETASASDGVALHDQTLPGREWFNAAEHPAATFETTHIVRRSDGRYEAAGVLTIKGKPIRIALPFTLSIEGDRAAMDGRVTLDRAEADLGQDSDPGGDYVSPTIDVIVHVEARRAQ